MTKILEGPSLDLVNSTLARLCDRANSGYRVRTVGIEIQAEDWAKPAYAVTAGGWGVSTSYSKKAFRAPTTSVAGVVWATGVGGCRYVLITASRLKTYPGRVGRLGPTPGWAYGEKWDPWFLLTKLVRQLVSGVVRIRLGKSDSEYIEDAASITPEQCRSLLRLMDVYGDAELEEYGEVDADRQALRVYTRLWDARNWPENAKPPLIEK